MSNENPAQFQSSLSEVSSMSNHRIRWAYPSLLLLMSCSCLLVAPVPSSAQTTTGNISGYVRDPSSAAVPDATVTAKLMEQQFSRTATANHEGFYTLQALPPGTYELTFEAKGFKRQTQTGVELTVNQNLRADAAI